MKKLDLREVKRILIIMMGGIGNTVLIIPALRTLREQLPGTNLTYMTGEPGVQDILDTEDLIDDVMMFDRRRQQGSLEKLRFVRALRKRKFDLAIVTSHTNPWNGSLLTFLAGIPNRVGEDVQGRGLLFTTKVPYQREVHETDGTNNLLNTMGIDVKEKWPSLNIKDDEISAADEFLSSNGVDEGDLLIGIHAGSGFKQSFKRWPKERFAQLADQLMDQHKARIIFTGGCQEKELIQEIQTLMRHQTVNAGGALSIRKTAALIEKCHLFISNDSGLAHVSAAVRTPLIVLFGETELHRIAPRGEKVHILRKEMPRQGNAQDQNSIVLISVDDVLEAAQQFIGAGV